MDYNRLLTRVFDKENKVMLYPGDKFNIGSEDVCYRGVSGSYLLITSQTCNNLGIPVDLLDHLSFGSRFVPMQCTAARTNDINRLLYESDIIKYKKSLAIIKWDLYEGLYLEPLIYDDNYKFHSTAFEACSYVGNKWENPKLLEQDK